MPAKNVAILPCRIQIIQFCFDAAKATFETNVEFGSTEALGLTDSAVLCRMIPTVAWLAFKQRAVAMTNQNEF